MPIPEEELLKIFRTIDEDGSGSIDAKELREAMLALGVKVSANSAAKVLKTIDTDGNGTVEWDEFQTFFSKVADPDEIKNLLSKENQRYFEYKQMVIGDPSFAKTYKCPPMSQPAAKLQGHNSDVQSLTWLSATSLVSCSIEGELFIWDTAQNKIGQSMQIQPSSLYCSSASKDGKWFACGHGTKTKSLSLFSLEAQQQTIYYEGHADPVYSCVFTSDGNSIASGTKTGKLCMHDKSQAEPAYTWQAHNGVVCSIEFKPKSDSIICTGSRDGTVKVFDIRTASEEGKAELTVDDAAASEAVHQAMWRGDCELLSCGDDYCMKRWDLRNLSRGPMVVTNYFGLSSPVRTITMSPDQRFLVSGTHCGSIRVWLADELGLVQSVCDREKDELARQQAIYKQQEDLQDTGEADVSLMVETNKRIKEAEERIVGISQTRKQMQDLSCSQAKLALDGPKMPMESLAWQDLNNQEAIIACGSQDQLVRIFKVDPSNLVAAYCG